MKAELPLRIGRAAIEDEVLEEEVESDMKKTPIKESGSSKQTTPSEKKEQKQEGANDALNMSF